MIENPRLKNTRSKDFRYVYANGLALQASSNEATLIFGIKEDPTSKTDVIQEEVGVILTLQTTKVLAMTLTKIVEAIESSGQKIPYDEEKFNKISAGISDALKKANPSPTS